MKKSILIPLFGLLLLASCTTIKQTATTTDVPVSVNQYPIVAEGEVMKKAEKTVSWDWNLFKSDKYSLRRGNLVAELLKEAGADYLLEPQFIVTKVSLGERTITVSGFPVKFKNFRNVTAEDLKALEVVGKGNEKVKYNAGSNLFFFKK